MVWNRMKYHGIEWKSMEQMKFYEQNVIVWNRPEWNIREWIGMEQT